MLENIKQGSRRGRRKKVDGRKSEYYNLRMSLWQHLNGYWYAEFETDKRRSLKTRDADLAKRLFTQLKRDYLKGKRLFLERNKIISISAFTDELLAYIKVHREHDTWRAYDLELRRFMEYDGGMRGPYQGYLRMQLRRPVLRRSDFMTCDTPLRVTL